MTVFANPVTEALSFFSRHIGNFRAQCTVSESSSDTLKITEHPVQRGVDFTDHAIKEQPALKIEAIFNPLFTPLKELYNNLLDLQSSREPFEIMTGKRLYKDMLCKNLAVVTDAQNEFILSILGEFTQITIVESQTTTVPASAVQKNAQITGAATTTGEKQVQSVDSSHLYQIFSGTQ